VLRRRRAAGALDAVLSATAVGDLLVAPRTAGRLASLVDGMLKERPGHPQSAPRLRQWLRPMAPAVLKLVSWWIARKIVEIPCEVTTVSGL